MQCDMFLIYMLHVVVLRKIFYIGHEKRLIIDLYLVIINVILLLYIHFSTLSNSNRVFISPLKSCDSQLEILINEWSEIFNSNWALKAQRKRALVFKRQVLSEIFKAKLNNYNVNIEQGQLNFDWFKHHCIVTKRFDWLRKKRIFYR